MKGWVQVRMRSLGQVETEEAAKPTEEMGEICKDPG